MFFGHTLCCYFCSPLSIPSLSCYKVHLSPSVSKDTTRSIPVSTEGLREVRWLAEGHWQSQNPSPASLVQDSVFLPLHQDPADPAVLHMDGTLGSFLGRQLPEAGSASTLKGCSALPSQSWRGEEGGALGTQCRVHCQKCSPRVESGSGLRLGAQSRKGSCAALWLSLLHLFLTNCPHIKNENRLRCL